MSEDLSSVVSTAKAHCTSLETWASQVLGHWDSYAAVHRDHSGYADCRDAWSGVRDGVNALTATVRTRLDDSGWVTDLESAEQVWRSVATEVDAAYEEVIERRLRATTSWQRGASDRYRATIPEQRTALLHASSGAGAAAQACLSASAAGLTHVTALRDALPPLLDALPPYFGQEDGGYPTNDYGDCTFGHHYSYGVGTMGTGPLATANTAVENAWTALDGAVHNAFGRSLPRRPGPQPDGGEGRVPVAGDFEDPWPTVGA